jgi:hypothetical protein
MVNQHVLVWIDFKLLQELATVGWTCNARCIKGLPMGARLVRSFTDERRGVAALVFEHESFDEVRLGEELPVIDVWFDTVKDE